MMLLIKAEALGGCTIKDAAREMIRLAKLLDATIELSFNGIELAASKSDTVKLIVQHYYRTLRAGEAAALLAHAESR